jgi:hypothetical protein
MVGLPHPTPGPGQQWPPWPVETHKEAPADERVPGAGRGPPQAARHQRACLRAQEDRPPRQVRPATVLFARVKLERMADPAVERPAVAEATLEVSGHPLRAHAAAEELEEAVDLLEDRLRQ